MDECNENFYIKYGDLAFYSDAKDILMKQKHRMVWERRHGPVGSGMEGSDFKKEWKAAQEAAQ